MLTTTLRSIFERDLKKLKSELELYLDEKNMWKVEVGITNSAGNLCLHLIGNLNWFVGAQLGNSGYLRQRELEFSAINIPRMELLKEIDKTWTAVDGALSHLTDDQLETDYPLVVFQNKMTTNFFLVHLTTHLAYHLGQINYHRRLLDK